MENLEGFVDRVFENALKDADNVVVTVDPRILAKSLKGLGSDDKVGVPRRRVPIRDIIAASPSSSASFSTSAASAAGAAGSAGNSPSFLLSSTAAPSILSSSSVDLARHNSGAAAIGSSASAMDQSCAFNLVAMPGSGPTKSTVAAIVG